MTDRDLTREEIEAGMTEAERLSAEVAELFAEASAQWFEESSHGAGMHTVNRGREVPEDWKECPECGTWFDANHCGYVVIPEKRFCSDKCENRAASRVRMRRMRSVVTGGCLKGVGTATTEAA